MSFKQRRAVVKSAVQKERFGSQWSEILPGFVGAKFTQFGGL